MVSNHESVERYNPALNPGKAPYYRKKAEMMYSATGKFILYSDHARTEAENKRLTAFCDEFVWGEENPQKYQSEMTRLTTENKRMEVALTTISEM